MGPDRGRPWRGLSRGSAPRTSAEGGRRIAQGPVPSRPPHPPPPREGHEPPSPPLPAVLLLPFVAVWGLATDAQLIASVVGGLDVGIVFWMLGRLGGPLAIRVAVTLFFALGTVFWYAAEKGTTWFLAHIVAV